MNAFLLDWIHLLRQSAHIVTGIARMSASFHVVPPGQSRARKSEADAEAGVGSAKAGLHGGGVCPSEATTFAWLHDRSVASVDSGRLSDWSGSGAGVTPC